MKGSSGSGKSTFGAELARRIGVPFIELDAIHNGPNWAEPTVEEFCARVRAAMADAQDGWVIDGNYERKLGQLVNHEADTLVWLDLPLHVVVPRLLRRSWRRINGRVELWAAGNRETWRGVLFERDALIPWTIRSYFRHRREWPRRFAPHPGFVRLRSAAEAAVWLDRLH